MSKRYTMKFQPINNCKQIDISKHALIEASAGTGKTYTIENLVVRLIEEKDIDIENILLLTFTEKATGELKKRIRENIAKELRKKDKEKKRQKKLRESLLAFDTASIYTIHGFCQSVLNDFSFETGQSFDLEVTYDEPLYEKLLYEQMRKSWHKEFGDDLPELLEISDFPSFNAIQDRSAWIDKVIKISMSYHQCMGDCIKPEIPDDIDLPGIDRRIKSKLSNILEEVGHIDKNQLENSDFYCAYNKLNFRENSKQSRLKNIILPLLQFLCDFKKSNNFSKSDLCDFTNAIKSKSSYKERGIYCLIPEKWKNPGPNLEETCPNLEKIVSYLELIIRDLETTSHIMTIKSITKLKKDVEKYKRQNRLISFDDMLILTAEAISNKNNKLYLQKLQTKYKYAIIDEFQDTDTIQWKIFKELFINGDDKKLFLIGDPKQAIYSFRGADVFAYLDAKKEFNNLAKNGRAVLYSLNINHRSGPNLITAFNHIFKQNNWFENSNPESDYEKINYHDVSPSNTIYDIPRNNVTRAPMTVVTINNVEKIPIAVSQFAEFISFEIDNLVKNELIIEKEINRSLDFGDLCILVRKKSEVPIIEKKLDDLNIPHAYYKKPGLYQSEEAIELLYLFRFIERPNNISALKKALLTSFFNIPIEKIDSYSDIDYDHPIRVLGSKWYETALKKKWSQLFQSIIEDSGFIVRELNKSNSERKLGNYRHIMQNLEILAYEQNLDFPSVINCLDSLRLQIVEIETESDLHRIESGKAKVKIMTIHSSKGLEFPIVFLLGGFTEYKNQLFYKYHEKGSVVYDLTKDKISNEKHNNEEDSENRRLYYVAFTRAKYRVYFPAYKPLKRMQHTGPVSNFIYDSIQYLKDNWKENDRDKCVQFVDVLNRESIIKKEKHNISKKEIIKIPDQLFPPESFNFYDRVVRTESFTSIIKKKSLYENRESLLSQNTTYQERDKDLDDDEAENMFNKTESISTSDTPEFPRGSHVGNMFHEILEKIDFTKIANARLKDKGYSFLLDDDDTVNLMTDRLRFNRIENEHMATVAKIIWNTLVTPIIDNNIPLAAIDDSNRIHELEFYYPACNTSDLLLPNGITLKNGFYTGFIDLVLSYNERYFIVDWKSNYISDGYDKQSMEKSMLESNYHFQCILYTKALLIWLKQYLGDNFNYKKNFGGVYFLFLRGIGSDHGNGIYYFSPEIENKGAVTF